MEESDRKKLRVKTVYLIDNLEQNDTFLNYLLANEIISDNKHEEFIELRKKEVKRVRNRNFMTFIVRCGPHAYQVLLDALIESSQRHIAHEIDPDRVPESVAEDPVYTVESSSDDESWTQNEALMAVELKPMNASKAQSLRKDTTNVYPLAAGKRGRCLIINMENFLPSSDLSIRTGSHYDVMNLDSLFTALNYDVDHARDLRKEDFLTRLEMEAMGEIHKSADSFVFIILSHGATGSVYAIDGQSIDIEDEITEYFNDRNCPSLKGKPRLFLIQACQGTLETIGVKCDGAGEAEVKSDMLIALATVQGFKSYRVCTLGTWFIRAFVEEVCKFAHKDHVQDILTNVCRHLNEKRTRELKTMVSEQRSTLTKKFYFFPKVQH